MNSDDAYAAIEAMDTNDCIRWPLSHGGAGHAAMRGNTVSRRLLGLEKGNPLVSRHTCHNPWCVNHRHLITGTPQQNSDDMKAAGRHRSSGGPLSRNPVIGQDWKTGEMVPEWWI